MGGVGVTESPTLRTGNRDSVPILPSVAKTPISNENGITSNPLHRTAAVAKVVPDEEAVEMPISHGFRITTELRFPFTNAGVGELPAFPSLPQRS
jgi:hypothetical protein